MNREANYGTTISASLPLSNSCSSTSRMSLAQRFELWALFSAWFLFPGWFDLVLHSQVFLVLQSCCSCFQFILPPLCSPCLLVKSLSLFLGVSILYVDSHFVPCALFLVLLPPRLILWFSLAVLFSPAMSSSPRCPFFFYIGVFSLVFLSVCFHVLCGFLISVPVLILCGLVPFWTLCYRLCFSSGALCFCLVYFLLCPACFLCLRFGSSSSHSVQSA